MGDFRRLPRCRQGRRPRRRDRELCRVDARDRPQRELHARRNRPRLRAADRVRRIDADAPPERRRGRLSRRDRSLGRRREEPRHGRAVRQGARARVRRCGSRQPHRHPRGERQDAEVPADEPRRHGRRAALPRHRRRLWLRLRPRRQRDGRDGDRHRLAAQQHATRHRRRELRERAELALLRGRAGR